MNGVFVHEKALCESRRVGTGSRIWAFAHVLPGAVIGADCNICDGVFIENDVVVGDRVTVKCGVQLWDGVRLHDDVFVGPNATFTNDAFPRSKVQRSRPGRTVVHAGASIGANATLLPDIEIGAAAMIGAGAVVTRSIPPYAIAVGNPARIVGYVGAKAADEEPGMTAGFGPAGRREAATDAVGVGGATLHRLPHAADIRGELAVAEFGSLLPFKPVRMFVVYNVPSKETRGEHAHKQCHQFLICLHGSVAVVVDDGHERREVALTDPREGLHLPPMVWGIQYKYTGDAVLLVLASHSYDPDDYIRSYASYREAVASSVAP
jgi:acetyltransferase-like isoleucine patch superfamily enzyme